MKTLFNLTTEIAESASVSSPKPPLYNVVFSIYQELGGSNNPKIIYDTLQAMLDEGLVSGGGGGGSIFDGLANAGYSAQDIAAVESISQDDVDLTETSYEDTSEEVYLPNKFKNSNLVYAPKLNTGNVTSFYSMFDNCKYLRFVPYLDTSKGNRFENMFRGCTNLELFPNLNLEKAQAVGEMFEGCIRLRVVPDLDLSGLTNSYNMYGMFANCTALVSIGKINVSSAEGAEIGSSGSKRPFYGCKVLENVGGFTGLKISINLQDCPLLTLQSVTNILTEAADLTGQTGATLTLHADAKARLTQAEYDLAASKNWTIA